MVATPYEFVLTHPIASRNDADLFIEALHDAGKLYHFDDSPETIENCVSGERIFTDQECVHLRFRVAEMFALEGYCPFEKALSLS